VSLEQEHHDRCATLIDHALRCTCEREQAYDQTTNAMDALSEDMNPVEPEGIAYPIYKAERLKPKHALKRRADLYWAVMLRAPGTKVIYCCTRGQNEAEHIAKALNDTMNQSDIC
jgi:hypothetical protein